MPSAAYSRVLCSALAGGGARDQPKCDPRHGTATITVWHGSVLSVLYLCQEVGGAHGHLSDDQDWWSTAIALVVDIHRLVATNSTRREQRSHMPIG